MYIRYQLTSLIIGVVYYIYKKSDQFFYLNIELILANHMICKCVVFVFMNQIHWAKLKYTPF